MAIKIVKKRHAGLGRLPSPLVDDQSAPVEPPENTGTVIGREKPVGSRVQVETPDPTPCSFCGHVYLFPCHGKDEDCQNAEWKRAQMAEAVRA